MMMHHPSGVARGQASDIQNEARELMRVRNYVNGVLSVATGQSQETVGPTPPVYAPVYDSLTRGGGTVRGARGSPLCTSWSQCRQQIRGRIVKPVDRLMYEPNFFEAVEKLWGD